MPTKNVQMNSDEEVMKEFDKLCHVNKFGECKYWKPEAFGYKSDDNKCSMDRFFPENVKTFLRSALELVGKREYNKGYEKAMQEMQSKK